MATADKIDVEFLKHGHADGGLPVLHPRLSDRGLREIACLQRL